MNSIPKPPALFGTAFERAGEITVNGIVAWLERLFFLPGDWLLWALATHAPRVAAFLDVSAADYGGLFAGIVSGTAWLAAFVIAGTVYTAVRDFDRALTQRLVALCRDLRVRLRVAARLAAYRLGRIGRPAAQRRRQEPVLELSEQIEVSVEQLKALHAHLRLKPGFALPVSEVAAAFGGRKADAARVLAGLERLHLLSRAMGGPDGESAYALTPAGRAFLVFRQMSAKSARSMAGMDNGSGRG
jgi:hypothetical protein